MRSGHLLFQTLKCSLAGQRYEMKQGFCWLLFSKKPTLFLLETEERQRIAHLHTCTPRRQGPGSDLPQPGLLSASLAQAYGGTNPTHGTGSHTCGSGAAGPSASGMGCSFASSSQSCILGTRRARRSRGVQWPYRRSARWVNAEIKHACPTHPHSSTSPEPGK